MIEKRPAHRPSSREEILDRSLELVREGASISLDSAARASGLTKPGLMYHFSTKASLMSAVVDRLLDTYEAELAARLPASAGEDADVEHRILAYLDWACAADFDAADLVMFLDPRLRELLSDQWARRIEPWLAVPPDLDVARRSALLSGRLVADGMWFAAASGILPLDPGDRRAIRDLARRLIQESA